MKQKIDHCNMEDLIEVKSLLTVLVMLRISAASPAIDDICSTMKYDFCEHCDEHLDHDCNCDKERDHDIYDDGDSFD